MKDKLVSTNYVFYKCILCSFASKCNTIFQVKKLCALDIFRKREKINELAMQLSDISRKRIKIDRRVIITRISGDSKNT